MALIKKAIEQFKDYFEAAEMLEEIAESKGIDLIRVKSFEKAKISPMHGIQSVTIRTVSGVEILDTRTGKIKIGKLTLYPGFDLHHYGYIPMTERNLRIMACGLRGGEFVPDDKAGKDAAIKFGKEEVGIEDFTRLKKRNELGLDTIKEQREKDNKKAKLEALQKKVAEKALDDEIAKLEAQLAGDEPEKTPEKTPEPVKEPEAPKAEPKEEAPKKEEPKSEEIVTPEVSTPKAKRSLSGVKVKKN